MRVLLVSDFYPPFIGGMEQITADLGAELRQRDHTVAVATLWHEGLARYEQLGGVAVHRLQGVAQHLPFLFNNPEQRFHPPLPDPLIATQIRRLVRRFRPDVVQGQSWMMLSALPLHGGRCFGTVAVLQDYSMVCPKKTLLYDEAHFCSHGLSRHCLRCAALTYGPLKGLVTTGGLGIGRQLYRQVDAFVAISSYVAEAHQRFGMATSAPLSIVPNFVRDALVLAPPLPPLPELPDEYVLFIGALGRHKGINVLLDAYRRLETTLPLVLIGAKMPTTPASLPPGVIMLPGLPHAKVMQALDHCRFLVTPALWPEPFGIVAIEAMARGKAVIASGAGGLLDIVRDGETGLLVPPGDVEGLASALCKLIDDPELAGRMGLAGAARCRAHFTASAVMPRMVTVYEQARAHARTVAPTETGSLVGRA